MYVFVYLCVCVCVCVCVVYFISSSCLCSSVSLFASVWRTSYVSSRPLALSLPPSLSLSLSLSLTSLVHLFVCVCVCVCVCGQRSCLISLPACFFVPSSLLSHFCMTILCVSSTATFAVSFGLCLFSRLCLDFISCIMPCFVYLIVSATFLFLLSACRAHFCLFPGSRNFSLQTTLSRACNRLHPESTQQQHAVQRQHLQHCVGDKSACAAAACVAV